MALDSKFAKLFEDIIARLETEVPELRHIDLDWGQLEMENPPVAFPCLLIDFTDASFTQMQGFQEGNTNVKFRLAYRSYTATTNWVPSVNRETALEFFELEQKHYSAMQAWYGGSNITLVNAMIRQNATTEKRDDGLRVRAIDYQCAFVDDTVTG